MTGLAGRVARSGSPLSMPRRSGRVVRASSKVSTALSTLEKVTAEANEINERNARSESVESEFQPAPESRKPQSNGETGRSLFQKLVELLEKSHEETRELKEEMKELKQKVKEQTLAIAKQDELIGNLNNMATQQGSSIKELQQELREATAELTEVRVQLETFAVAASRTAGSSSQATYAEIARTPPGSAPSNIRTLSSGKTTPSIATDMFYCTIDCSRVTVEDSSRVTAGGIRATLEREMRTEQESATWRCRAVTRDPKDPSRIRVMCRDEKEQQKIKQLAEAKLPEGTRVLRDDLHRIRVDNVARDAVLDQAGVELPNVTELLSSQNDTKIAKVAWLSDRFLKQHGSIVVYLETATDAKRFLAEGFFAPANSPGGLHPSDAVKDRTNATTARH